MRTLIHNKDSGNYRDPSVGDCIPRMHYFSHESYFIRVKLLLYAFFSMYVSIVYVEKPWNPTSFVLL